MKAALVAFALVILGFFYGKNYAVRKFDNDEIYFYNPFSIDEEGFAKYYDLAHKHLEKHETAKAKECFKMALKYRGTHNEKISESLFSCGNDFWEYKQIKLLKFAVCFEKLDLIDSAMKCLEPALTNIERTHYNTDEQFFRLAFKKFGRKAVFDELELAVSKIYELDCFMCLDYYFNFKAIKIGIDNYDHELDKMELFNELKGKYEKLN